MEVTETKKPTWSVRDGIYLVPPPPAEHTDALPAGVYESGFSFETGPYLIRKEIVTDKIVHLPNPAGDRIIASLERFWASEQRYRKYGQLFKRGILLYGPPGSGKTALLMQLSKQLQELDGLVFFFESPGQASQTLSIVRNREPHRPLIAMFEDIDNVVHRHGDHELLSLLDGQDKVDNVVFLATTNYPERLDKRLVNRPSRFDEVIEVGMPPIETRRGYLQAIVPDSELTESELNDWASRTAGLSLAHLKELVVAVKVLDTPFEDALSRLRQLDSTNLTSKKSSDDDDDDDLTEVPFKLSTARVSRAIQGLAQG